MEPIDVTLPKHVQIKLIGKVKALIELMCIVQSVHGAPPLNADSILWKADRTPFGRVFEIFGPVSAPLYSVRLSSEEHSVSYVVKHMSIVYTSSRLK